MSEKFNEITEGSFLCVNEEGKAYWRQSEGGGGPLMVNYDGNTLSHSFDEIFSHIQGGGFAYLVLLGMYYIPLQGAMNDSIAFAGHNPMNNRQYYIFTVAKIDGKTTVIQQTGTFAMDSDFTQA